MLLFTQYKPTWLTTIGSQCLAALSANVARCLRSTVTCGKTSATATGAEAEVKIFAVFVTQWRSTVEQSARKFGNLPLQAKKQCMSELQAHHCMTPEQW